MSEKVTYGEIVDALARKSGQSKQKSEAFTKALIAEIKDELQENGKASITNFGSFKVKEVNERQGQNPQTGEPMTIPAHKRVSFSPYKALRETVNQKYAHLEPRLVKEGGSKAVEDSQKQSKEDPKKSEADDSKGMSTTTMVLGILVPAVVLILVALFLLFDPFGSENTATSSVPMPPATEMPAQSENTETEQETETESNSQQEQQETGSSDSPENETQEARTDEQSTEIDNEPISVESTETQADYRINQNEWYWVIAENIYGNAQFWPLLFQQNQSVDDDPDQVSASQGLVVPELEGNSDNLSEADFQNLAAAARMVSEAYRNASKPDKAEAYALLAAKWEREIQ